MKSLIASILALLATTAAADPLKLVTEEYPPYAYRANGALTGSSIDQVNLMMSSKRQNLLKSISNMNLEFTINGGFFKPTCQLFQVGFISRTDLSIELTSLFVRTIGAGFNGLHHMQ